MLHQGEVKFASPLFLSSGATKLDCYATNTESYSSLKRQLDALLPFLKRSQI